ncbi:MAG: radical SAM protein [Candidatus Saganbacteria bacterium]|nr:radical SAM protein [Candidatus Saganbacteria bacterium]
MKVFIKGLNSCTMRKQKLRQYRDFIIANGHGIAGHPAESDVILLWTCGFRKDVRDNSIAEIARYQQEFKARLLICGCLPDIAPELINSYLLNGQIIRWREDKRKMEDFFGCKKLSFDKISPIFVEEDICDDVQKYRKDNPHKDATFHDQFIKLLVSEGCNYKCSYCSERLAFPPYHSFPEDALIDSCRQMIKNRGCFRIILLADSLGDYGRDIGTDLPTLIKKMKKIHPNLKFALNNLNPEGFIRFYDEILWLIKNKDIIHLNLPIQSASDKVLKLMNRPYGSGEIERIFSMLNNIGFMEFDTHIIVGFPGEEYRDFEQTVEFILKHKPKYVLASSFMETPRMDACTLPHKVDEAVKRYRLNFAKSRFDSVEIICNTDDSELSMDRRRRLNLT